MVNFFDKLYTSIKDKNKVLVRFRIYSIVRFLIRLFANIIIPLYFRMTQSNKKYSLNATTTSKENITIASLTSFPARINKVWLVIETLLRQTHKPDKIILWLSKEQFPDLNTIPNNLLKLRTRGLDIRLCEDDLKSHKKYYYSFKEYPNDIIMTFDDDILYPSFITEKLMFYHNRFPNRICCHRACIRSSKRYKDWKAAKSENTEILNNLFFTTGGGTLFPPYSLYDDFLNEALFKKISFYADDVWLNCMAILKNSSVVKTDYFSVCLPVLNKSNFTLDSINNGEESLNDKQISLLKEYYVQTLGINPFAVT